MNSPFPKNSRLAARFWRLALWALLLSPQAALWAATYYVSNAGADANPGSLDQPWATVQRAADRMAAGDVALVAPGTYAENVISKTAGRADAPVTFRAAAPGAVVSSFLFKHPYHVVEGFTLTGQGVGGYQGVVAIRAGGDHAVIRSNTFNSSPANVYQMLIDGSTPTTDITIDQNQFLAGNFHAVALTGSGHTVTGNLFTSPNGWDAIRANASNTRIAGNTFKNWSNLVNNTNHPDLIQAFTNSGQTAANVLIEGNLAQDCVGTQIGHIQNQENKGVQDWTWRNNVFANVDSAMSMYAPGFAFYNNTFYRSGTNTGSVLMFRHSDTRGSCDNCKVFNNLFVECSSRASDPRYGWYGLEAGITGFQGDHNLVVGVDAGRAKTNFAAAGREAGGINGQDPLFVDPANGNFRLLPRSPAIGAGVNLSALFTKDLAGNARGDSWDIGAYQHTAPPLPPHGLRKVTPR